jgi:hypothetical protein
MCGRRRRRERRQVTATLVAGVLVLLSCPGPGHTPLVTTPRHATHPTRWLVASQNESRISAIAVDTSISTSTFFLHINPQSLSPFNSHPPRSRGSTARAHRPLAWERETQARIHENRRDRAGEHLTDYRLAPSRSTRFTCRPYSLFLLRGRQLDPTPTDHWDPSS